jgi:hypothetical protein
MRLKTATALGLAFVVAVLAGCGGSGAADANGFTPGDRKAAQNALTSLAQTSVYDAALKISLTQAEPPTKCVVHIETAKPLTFKVFMAWQPNAEIVAAGYARSYSWLEAVVGPDGVNGDYSFHQGNELTEGDLTARYGNAFAKPAAKCLVLQNRKFGLLPA